MNSVSQDFDCVVEVGGFRVRVSGDTYSYWKNVCKYGGVRKTVNRRGKRFNFKIGPRFVAHSIPMNVRAE